MYAYPRAHKQVDAGVLNERKACREPVEANQLYTLSLSAVNANMQQYNWIIGAIISATVSCVLRSEQPHYSKLERLRVSIKLYKNI